MPFSFYFWIYLGQNKGPFSSLITVIISGMMNVSLLDILKTCYHKDSVLWQLWIQLATIFSKVIDITEFEDQFEESKNNGF